MKSEFESKQAIKQNLYIISVLVFFAVASLWLTFQIKSISDELIHVKKEKIESVLLVDELRQSSDDLTNMARLYVVSGEEKYKQYFNEIINIREGKQIRPNDYQDVYWDFVLATGSKPRPGSKSYALLELLDSLSSSNEVKSFFIQAKESSDGLILIEEEAFNAMNGFFKDSLGNYTIKGETNQKLAIELLNSQEYFEAKAKIMASIQDFSHYLSTYTDGIIRDLEEQRDSYHQYLMILLLIVGFLLFINLVTRLKKLFKGNKKSTDFNKNVVLKELSNSWILLATSLSFSVLVVLYLGYTNKNIYEENQKALKSSLSTVLESTESGITDLLTNVERDVINLSQNISIINFIKDNKENKIDLVLKNQLKNISYKGFIITDNNDKILTTDILEWKEKSLSEIIGKDFIRTNKKGDVQTIFPSLNGFNNLYNLSIKVISNIDKEHQLIVLINPQGPFSKKLQLGRLGESGESYAFNKKGLMVSESRFTEQLIEQKLLKAGQLSELNIALKDPITKNYTVMAQDAIKGYSGINVDGYNDYRGVKVIGVWMWLEKYQIGIATEIDYEEAFKSYIQVKRMTWSTGVLFNVLLLILTIIFILDRIKLAKLNNEMENQASLLTSLLNSIPDLIFYKDKESNYLGANKAFGELVGKQPSEFVGKNDYALFPKDIASFFIKKDNEILTERSAKNNEEEVSYPNGRKIMLDTLKTPFYNNEGELLGLIGISRDITEKKEFETKIIASENKFKQLLDSTPDAIIIIDKTGTIQIVNNQMLILFGYERNDIIGEKVEILMSPEYSKNHVNHREGYFARPNSRGMDALDDLYAIKKDGTKIPVEISLNPIESDEGKFVAAAIRDVTERKVAENVIKESEAKFRSITATASDAIISANIQGRIESWNNAAEIIFGYTAEEALGQTMELIIPEKHHDAHQRGMKRVISGGKRNAIGKTVELEGRRKDGTHIPIELALSSWENDGKIQFSGIIRDISERKRFESLIKESEQRLKFAIEGSNDGLWDWNVKTGEVYLSPRFEIMLGYEPGTLHLSYDSMKDLVHKDDLAIMLETMRDHYEGKTDQYELEYRIKDYSNDYIWILSKGKMVEFDDEGNPIRFVGIHSDISERKELEAQVLQSEEQLKAALEGSNDGVFDINYSTGGMYVSPLFETMLGYNIGELQKSCDSQLLFDLVHEKDFDKLESALEKHLSGESGNFSCEYRLKMKNGSYKWIAARAKVVGQDTSGLEEIRLVGTHSDIQRRKELEIQLEQANIRMSGELNVAKEIQMSMLPLTFPAFPKRKDIDIFAALIPAREVGGDFYDFHFLDDNHLYFVVGDVSGKGVPAALMMAVCKTLLKSKAGTDMSTASIMTQVNNEMALENTNYMFVTVFLGILNTNTGELTYTNAGHNPTYIKKIDGSIEKLAELHGPVVAAMEGLTYGESKTQLKTSEFIFAYTDGVPEAHNNNEELYGNDKMENFLIKNSFHSPQRVTEDIIISVREFEDGAEKFDDLTALCIEFHGANAESLKRELIEIFNRIENVPLAIEKFEKFSEANDLPMAISMKISIVLDELLANVVNYAYNDDAEHNIYIEYKVSGDKLIIVIEDDGKPFNPFSQNPPDTKLSIDERAIGGLGIHLVKNLMDECIYSRTANKNVVTLTKYKLSENK